MPLFVDRIGLSFLLLVVLQLFGSSSSSHSVPPPPPHRTVSTLKYASRARNIRNKPTVNRDPATAELATLRGQLARAKAELAALKGQLEGGGGIVGSILQHVRQRGRDRQGTESTRLFVTLLPRCHVALM